MRRILAAVLAVPVILTIYLPRSLRRLPVAQTLLVLALPVGLVGISAVRQELAPHPASAAVAGVAATPFPDAVFEPVAVAAAPAAPAAPAAALRAPTPPDRPDRAAATRGRSGFLVVPAPKAPAPAVVRFRPAAKAANIARDAEVSVRFTVAMDEAVTARTFSAAVGGTRVKGALRWAEGSTVLVLRPASRFPAGATVVLTVGPTARSAAGVPLGAVASARFTVAKPAPKPAGRTTKIPRSVAPGLYGVELYALELVNCTRTGGWVRSDGTCRGGGTRNVAPLKLDAGISDRVARPYAQLLASRRLCHHFYDGDPGSRMRRAGFTNWDWAENVGGCGSNAPYASVLSTHIYFQSEKSYNGGHYRNLMNPKYDRVGIGAVKVRGVFRIVFNFYHP